MSRVTRTPSLSAAPAATFEQPFEMLVAHRDEEMHVFPPLIAQGDAPVLALVGRLQQDHLQMESRWTRARSVLAAVAAGATHALAPDDEAALDAFASLYAGHIEAEEAIAYPAAAAR